MTKYILNSGNVRNYPDLAKKYFVEIFKGLGDKPRLLVCLFAQMREEWEMKYAKYKDALPALFPEDVHPTLELALPSTFETQLKTSDALYIHGGDDHLLRYWLMKFDLPRIWDEKVVATSSAGSNAVSRHFWTCDWRQCMNGLGLLPAKFLPHFKSNYGKDDPRGPVDWQQAYEELTNYGDASLPIYALEEGEYVVINE